MWPDSQGSNSSPSIEQENVTFGWFASNVNVALRSVDSLKVMFAPFLPFSSQKLHESLGYDGTLAGAPERRTVREADGSTHDVLTGEYTKSVGTWAPPQVPIGQKLRTPEPLFKKLDPDVVVAEELRRMEEREGK